MVFPKQSYIIHKDLHLYKETSMTLQNTLKLKKINERIEKLEKERETLKEQKAKILITCIKDLNLLGEDLETVVGALYDIKKNLQTMCPENQDILQKKGRALLKKHSRKTPKKDLS